jgi:hypothetical protein
MSADPQIIGSLALQVAPNTLSLIYDAVIRYLTAEKPSDVKIFVKNINAKSKSVLVEQINQVIREREATDSPETSRQFTLDIVEGTYKNLMNIRQERLRQAQMVFNMALGLTTLGVLIILVGVILLFMGNVPVATVTMVVGAIPEVISAVLFRFNKDTNDRLDKITEDINLIDKTRMGLQIIGQINDSGKRDKAISEIIKNLNSTRAS